jgi:hypothetical protein
MQHRYAILNLNSMTYLENDEGNIKLYENFDAAYRASQKYEIQDAMVPIRL